MNKFFEAIQDAIFGNDRREDFEYFAVKNGFTYLNRASYKDIGFEVRNLSIFKNKQNKSFRNLILKKAPSIDGVITLFDYHYYSDYDKKSMTVLVLESSCIHLPDFVIRPKRMFDKMGNIFFSESPTYPDYPEFDERYVIKGQRNETVAYVLSPEVAKMLTQYPEKLYVETLGNRIAFYNTNHLLDPPVLMNFINFGIDVCETVINDDSKDYV